ncbi:MAG TPA: hypothetical protein VH593_01895 [Ktedonobacteraceae bacterium]
MERAAWKVDFTDPPKEERKWVVNRNVTVIAATLERVVELVLEMYPGCTLIAIHRVGSERTVIVDDH